MMADAGKQVGTRVRRVGNAPADEVGGRPEDHDREAIPGRTGVFAPFDASAACAARHERG
jgi:hypothetical protein